MRWRGLLAGALVACAATGLAACALQPTGITDGSGRLTRVSPAGPYVFFYVNGTLRPLLPDRSVATPDRELPGAIFPLPTAGVDDDPRSRTVWSSLQSLGGGPTPAQRSAGVTTALPDGVALASLSATDDAVLVGMGLDSPDLPEPALVQLSCTLTSAMSAPGKIWTGTITMVKAPGDTRRSVPPCDIRYLEALPYSA